VTALCYETIARSPAPGAAGPDLAAELCAAADAGFTWVGLDLASVEAFLHTGASVAELRDLVREAGLRCFVLQHLALGPDEGRVLRSAERLAELAAVLQPVWVQAGVGAAPDDAATLGLTRRAARMFAEVGTRLSIEFLPFLPVDSIAAARAFVRNAAAAGAGVVVDAWHFFHGPDDWPDLETLPLEALAYPQLDDHPRIEAGGARELYRATVDGRVLPGEGVFDLDRFCDTLRAIGYDGVVSVEVLSRAWRERPVREFARALHEASVAYWPAEGTPARGSRGIGAPSGRASTSSDD